MGKDLKMSVPRFLVWVPHDILTFLWLPLTPLHHAAHIIINDVLFYIICGSSESLKVFRRRNNSGT